MTIVLVGTSSTIHGQLARLQDELWGVVKSGPKIRWDSRDDHHADFLADDEVK